MRRQLGHADGVAVDDVRRRLRLHAYEARSRADAVARELRHLQPAKVNIAALGNAVPHLHWHVIARFDWDSHFPGAVWAGMQRAPDPQKLEAVEARLPALEQDLVARL